MAKLNKLFQAMVTEYQQLVYSQAAYILGNRHEAEDACQDAFERLWKHMNKAGGKTMSKEHGKAWLLHVNKNLCIDRLRRRKPEVADDTDTLAGAETQQPARATASAELGSWLREKVAQLKEPYRSLITLVDLQQRPLQEVAAILTLKESQARVYIHRGRKQLRSLLQGVDL